MKKLNISTLISSTLLGTLLFVALGLTGCDNKQELLFGETNNGRALDLLEQCEKTLLANPNGWQMTYKVPKQSIGGEYTVQMLFGENKSVKMWADYLDEPTTSTYALSLYSGPMISFDTPGALTVLADPSLQPNPSIKKGEGYWGENDFIIYSVSPEKIVLKGLKYSEKVELIPLKEPAGLSNNGITGLIHTLANQLTQYGSAVVLMNGEQPLNSISFDVSALKSLVSSTNPTNFTMILAPMNEGEEEKEFVVSYAEGGFHLEPALEVDGKSYSDFVYDEEGKRFSAKDNPNVWINLSPLPLMLRPGGYFTKGFFVLNDADPITSSLFAKSKIGAVLPGFATLQWYITSDIKEFDFMCRDENGKAFWPGITYELEEVAPYEGIYSFKFTGTTHDLIDKALALGSKDLNAVFLFTGFFTTAGGEDNKVMISLQDPDNGIVRIQEISSKYKLWVEFKFIEN